MEIGKVVYVNAKRGMFVAQFDNEACSVIEIFDTVDVEVGSTIKGALNDEGFCTIFNLTANESFDATVQFAGCSIERAINKAILI